MNSGILHPSLGAPVGSQSWLAARISEILLTRGLCDAEALERGFTVLAQPEAAGPLARERPEEARAVARFGEAVIYPNLVSREMRAPM